MTVFGFLLFKIVFCGGVQMKITELYAYGRKTVTGTWHISHATTVSRLYFPHTGGAYYISGGVKTFFEPGKVYLLTSSEHYTLGLCDGASFDHTYFDFDIIPPLSSPLILPATGVLSHACKYCDKLISEFRDCPDRFADFMAAELDNILLFIEKTEYPQRVSDARIEEAMSFIRENFSRPMTVSDIAARVHLEKTYLIKLFKRTVCMTPHVYLRAYRLDRAEAMLRSGISVGDAALLCGFESTSSFSHTFKKSRGYPPAEFRR